MAEWDIHAEQGTWTIACNGEQQQTGTKPAMWAYVAAHAAAYDVVRIHYAGGHSPTVLNGARLRQLLEWMRVGHDAA